MVAISAVDWVAGVESECSVMSNTVFEYPLFVFLVLFCVLPVLLVLLFVLPVIPVLFY